MESTPSYGRGDGQGRRADVYRREQAFLRPPGLEYLGCLGDRSDAAGGRWGGRGSAVSRVLRSVGGPVPCLGVQRTPAGRYLMPHSKMANAPQNLAGAGWSLGSLFDRQLERLLCGSASVNVDRQLMAPRRQPIISVQRKSMNRPFISARFPGIDCDCSCSRWPTSLA